MTSTSRRKRPAVKPTSTPVHYLPQPPEDDEVYQYFGAHRPWAFAWLLVAASGIIYGYVQVSREAWIVTPIMLLFLMVMVPPVIVNFWLRTGRPRLTLEEHREKTRRWRVAREPSVDVFIPCCGEPLEVLDNTFYHVNRIAWRGTKTVWVLDDGASDALRDLAHRYGFRHVIRPNRGWLKKAGMRVAFLSNLTAAMLEAGIHNSQLDGLFDHVLSTDRVRTYSLILAPIRWASTLLA